MLRHFQPSTRWNRAAIPGSKPPNADAAFDPTDPSAPAIYGPQLPLVDASDAALQLHQTGRSCTAQHFREANDGSGGRCQLSLHSRQRPLWQPQCSPVFPRNAKNGANSL